MERGFENLRDFAGRLRRIAKPGSKPGLRDAAVPVNPEGQVTRSEPRMQRRPPFG
jgi:hypothetical protein